MILGFKGLGYFVPSHHSARVFHARIPSFSRFSLAKACEGSSLHMYNLLAPGSFAQVNTVF